MNKTWLIAIPDILALIAVYAVIVLLLVNYSLAGQFRTSSPEPLSRVW
ncbi:MAG: hypothetical protein GWP10_07195 [Nitrospiraceae bacterium]|nr:hypothetical protein [Nitrospiraceae bacterium]